MKLNINLPHYAVVIPDRALVLDWVFADGPPRSATVYDNNNYLDFHAIIPNVLSEELFWVEEEHRIYRKLQEERKQKQEAAQRKVSLKNCLFSPLSNTFSYILSCKVADYLVQYLTIITKPFPVNIGFIINCKSALKSL